MQTVPSLVGTGTAVAAAASGLMFGQPTEPNPPTTRRASHKRTTSTDRALEANHRPTNLTPARPATTSAASSIGTEHAYPHTISHRETISRPPLSRYQRPQSSQVTSPKTLGRRQSIARHGGGLSPTRVAEGSRDSVSSNGSWIKRLSIRPLSQHGSARSSFIAESPSVTFSSSAMVPMLSRSSSTAPPLPPNKLVKRSSSTQNDELGDASPRRRARGHLPTLRRPATSHQRSATLQQFRADVDVAGSAAHPKYSFENPIWPEELLGASPIDRLPETQSKSAWTSFFHSRTASIPASATVPSRLGDASPSARSSGLKRICPGRGQRQRVHLVKPRMVSATPAPGVALTPAGVEEPDQQATKVVASLRAPPEIAPATRTRRSLSASLATAGNWVSKTSGSLRRPKRGADHQQQNGGNQRGVSHPAGGSQSGVDQESNALEKPAGAPIAPQGSTLDSAATVRRAVHKRNSSSPHPPLSLSTARGFHDDLSRLGRPGWASTHQARPNQPSGSSTSSAAMSQLRGSHYERSSVMESSDGDARGFTSGDDDDTDFKSDTVFDSLRTLASGRVRAVETPLDSVYDESPPSTAGNGKTKRLSMQEMLGGRGWNEGNKITEEEDENAPTPVRATEHAGAKFPSRDVLVSLESSHGVSQPARDFGRFSLDDDFDEDWTRDDDAPCSPLSPPSKGSSLNAKINPNVRLALASIEGESRTTGNAHRGERPLSSLFDWSEPLHDKQDNGAHSLRPRTAYAKPEMDSRGGRSAIRKGPMPTHVRSQSVPVVHDVADDSKPASSKYGTWGMGTRTVSEDWDEDFEFGGGNAGNDDKGNGHMFAVPESIRATQPSVKAHSGQIRELSLLVNDLKRLCRHGRDMNMLNGEQKGLWKEAEGIIALASPDEDDVNEDHQSTSSVDLDSLDINHRLVEGGYDPASLDRLDAAIDSQEPAMSKTAVVRERQSPRRRSVFSPEDDIFGGNWPLPDESTQPGRPSRPRTPDNRASKPGDVTGVVRSVMESMHHRSSTEPTHEPRNNHHNKRVHFDTNSLKALVRRAGELRDSLSDMIRRADQITQSPARTPRHERRLESSPAFTRVFDDPGSSPRRVVKSRGTNPMMDGASPDKSPSSPMDRRVPMMTVG
ncbi:Uncharacterized protein TPAR_05361 [Tolypocladium paradoxum]|uniref:Uncharacterized protein n=1 Tax=Tolypocladium paradoxum TaxID=94208 RepID=A0A2S4KW50_9HYPO|nr:Uncharacterized protein TPAR_05361 [Tolypocladium paradoxum]